MNFRKQLLASAAAAVATPETIQVICREIFVMTRLLVPFFLFVSAVATAAPMPVLTVEYSADRTMETDEDTLQGSIIATPAVERSEVRIGDMSTVMILRKDKQTGYMLLPAQKMYQELDFAKASQQAGAVNPEQMTFETIGQETVSGQVTTKYKFVMKDKSAGGFVWYTATGIPVKMDVLSKTGKSKTRMTVTLDNIKIGPQDARAFEVPAGFAKMPSAGVFGMAAPKRAPGPIPGSDVAGAAFDAASHTASAEVVADVSGAIDNPIGRSAGVAAARKVLNKLPGLLRKKQPTTDQ